MVMNSASRPLDHAACPVFGGWPDIPLFLEKSSVNLQLGIDDPTLWAGLLECTPSPGLAACTITLNITTAGSYVLSLQQEGVPIGCSADAAAAQVRLMQHVILHL